MFIKATTIGVLVLATVGVVSPASATQYDDLDVVRVAVLAPDDAFEQAMRLLRRSDGSSPTPGEVARAGDLLMHAGPDAFERAMQLLKQPVRHFSDTEIAEAKHGMIEGGSDGFGKAMQLLRRSVGY